MSKQKINMVGVICKNWEVISQGVPPEKIKNKSSIWWNCRCLKCGRIKVFNGTEIRQNRIGECRCDYKSTKKKKSSTTETKKYLKDTKIIDETNNKYGKLLVQNLAYTDNGLAYWNCLCECGNQVVVRGNHLRNNRTKSCGCIVSFKEQEIEKILNNYNFSFKREYSFQDLNDKGYLRFDFAIFQKNKLLGLIEYQGEQHIELPNKFNHFGLLQYHDRMKKEYCDKHNIPLLLLDKNSVLDRDIIKWINNIES